MDIILATGNEKINKSITANISNGKVIGAVANRQSLLSICERLSPDVVVLSLLLPGREDMKEVVFRCQTICNCRIVLLARSPEPYLQEYFYLGVRDFIYDPIQLPRLFDAIESPSSYSAAVNNIKTASQGASTKKLKSLFSKMSSEVKPEVQSSLNIDAREVIVGILNLLDLPLSRVVEDNLISIEEAIITMVRNQSE